MVHGYIKRCGDVDRIRYVASVDPLGFGLSRVNDDRLRDALAGPERQRGPRVQFRELESGRCSNQLQRSLRCLETSEVVIEVLSRASLP